MIAIADEVFTDCTNLTKIVFLGKSLDDVKDDGNYPFGLTPEQEALIETFNDRIADGSGNVIKADRTTIRAGESQWDVLATSGDIDAAISSKADVSAFADLSNDYVARLEDNTGAKTAVTFGTRKNGTTA